MDCIRLTELQIPEGVRIIEKLAFLNSRNLKRIVLPASFERFDEGNDPAFRRDFAFRGCESLTAINVAENNLNFCSIDGVLFDKSMKTLLTYPGSKPDEYYEIPEGVKRIQHDAFSEKCRLTRIRFPASVEEGVVQFFANLNSYDVAD